MGILLGSVLVTVLLYYEVIPYGRTIAYPLLLLSTIAQERSSSDASAPSQPPVQRAVLLVPPWSLRAAVAELVPAWWPLVPEPCFGAAWCRPIF